MKLRIAYLCGEYPRVTDTFIQREVAALRGAHVDVETISVRRPPAREQGSREQQAERQRTRYLLPCNPLRLCVDHLQMLLMSPLRYLQAMWIAFVVRGPGLAALLRQLAYFAEAGMIAAHMHRRAIPHLHNHAPDASGYVAMIAACMGRFTYSMTLHGFGILAEPSRWRLREKLERSAFAICVSSYARSQAMLWTDPQHWSRFHVVHCGIDPDSATLRTHDGPGNRLLFVGRLDSVKGLPLLFEAVCRLKRERPDVQLDIIGDGPERIRLEAMAREMNLDEAVAFHGYLSQRELRNFWCCADVKVMSSFVEGVPVSLMEAMAHGLPVVAPRITGIPELVQDGVTGKLTTPGDSEELARCVGELLDDPGLRARMGRAGAGIVRCQFNLDVEVAKLVRIMKQHLQHDEQLLEADVETATRPSADVHTNISVGAWK
jgi:colanic acid/amylovoran biosynthesis glycosyltransferase